MCPAPTLIIIRSGVQSVATKMASVCRMPFCFSFPPFFPPQNMHNNLLSLCLQWESPSLHMTVPQPSHCPICLSALASLWPHCSTGRSGLAYWFTWGKSMCSKAGFVCLPLLSSHPPRPSAASFSVGRFCFWPRYWKEIFPHAVSKCISHTAKWGKTEGYLR